MEIQARFAHEKINHTVDTDEHLVLSITAPTLDWVKQRPKLCVLPVIDLSGSMRGPKLEYAKRSLLKLIEHLAPGDLCGLYGFATHLRKLVEPQAITPELKVQLKKVISDLEVVGGTNFSAGLLGGIQALKLLDLPVSFKQRVIMFTDGQPTDGITDTDAILKMMKEAVGNVTVSAFGYGNVGGGVWDGCDQEFLTELSKQANGNYAYVKDPDDALAAFGKELGGLLSSYASDIVIEVEPANGHQITKVVTDVPFEEDVTGTYEIRLADLLAEETRHLVLQTKLAKQPKVFPRAATVFNIKMTYSTLTQAGVRSTETAEAKAKVQFVKADDVQVEANKELDSIIGLAQMIRTQIEAEQNAKAGDFQKASSLMSAMSDHLQHRGLDNLGSLAHNIGQRLSSSHTYTSSAGYLGSMRSAGTRAYAVSNLDADAQRDLGGLVQLNNSVQASLVNAFSTTPKTSK